MAAAGRLGRHGHRDATLILLAYRHGLRVSELVALRSEQIDLKPGLCTSTGSRTGWPPRILCAAPSSCPATAPTRLSSVALRVHHRAPRAAHLGDRLRRRAVHCRGAAGEQGSTDKFRGSWLMSSPLRADRGGSNSRARPGGWPGECDPRRRIEAPDQASGMPLALRILAICPAWSFQW